MSVEVRVQKSRNFLIYMDWFWKQTLLEIKQIYRLPPTYVWIQHIERYLST